MVFVYVLRNSLNIELYVGISDNPSRRLKEHNSGKNRYTKAFAPWTIVFLETYPDYMTAREREKYLKSASGKRFLRKYLSEQNL
jgi:predicted GIY-YIG superfamily endonuclease